MKRPDMHYGNAGLMAATIGLAILVYLATCTTARATPHEVHYRNADATRSVAALRICQGATCKDVSSSCAPMATCAAVVDLDPGSFSTTALVSEAPSGPWSPPSNALSITVPTFERWCLDLDACRFDVDASHSVTVSDFGRFLRALGAAW